MSKLPKRKRTLSGELSERFRTLDAESRRAPSLAGTGLEVVDPGGGGTTGSVRIPQGGQLLIDGGDVIMLDELGVELFRLGIQEHGDRGIMFRRVDGTKALEVRASFPGGPQQVMMWDRAGRAIGGDAALSGGSGIDRPHQHLHWLPTNYDATTLSQSTTSATFVALFEHRGHFQNVALPIQLAAKCSDATTAGEIQVYNVLGAGYLGGFLGSPAVHTIAVPTGTTAYTIVEPSSTIALPGQMSDAMHLQIHVRRTAGTGSVSVLPVRSQGSGF